MRAVVWTRYGPPETLELSEVPTPVPRDDELLVRVRATTVAAGDCELRALRFSIGLRILVRLLFGIYRPRRRVLGQEFAGEVQKVGRAVSRFRVGDRVFGTTGWRFGAYAEYLCVSERSPGRAVAAMPTRATFVEAAAVPTGGLEALHFLRAAGELRGRRVLIHGGGGGIGTFAIQLAKRSGADVTAVDGPTKQDVMLSLGADRAVDYTRPNPSTDAETFDVVFDVPGSTSFSASLRRLRDGGAYFVANPPWATRARALRSSRSRGRTIVVRAAAQRSADLEDLARMIERGELRSYVDRVYSLEEIREAHRYVDAGLARGKVAVAVD